VATVVRSVTPLIRTPLLTVGEFRCPPEDVAWREPNVIGDRAHVVFARIPVVIQHEGAEPVLATPNHAMLYNADQLYHRELRDEIGDDCVYIELPDESLAGLAQEGAALVDGNGRLVASHVRTGRRTYLLQHLLVRHLRGRSPDPLIAEETAAALARSALRERPRHDRSRRAAAAHRELAEGAKAELAAALDRRLTLCDLAARLHSSAFHLARVFRAETGFSLQGFRQALRLRAALERLPSSGRDLSAVAQELGFSSHSHFSERFRNEFGVTPSQVRDDRRVRALLQAAARD
jgi:AraC family transcriptional regulator